MSHNPYECRYTFESECNWTPFVYKDSFQVVKLKDNGTFDNLIKLTDKEFSELIYSSSNQTD